MPELRLARDPEELLESLPIPDAEAAAEAVARARAAADERPIDYRFGTAEAEEVALLAGIKPVLRQFLREGSGGDSGRELGQGAVKAAGELERARARFGAHALHLVEARSTFVDPPFPGRVLYAGRDPEQVRAAASADAESGRERELGRLLGYPRCCVERYLATPAPRRNVDLLRAALAATRGQPEPRLNVCDLAVFHYISWVPCSLTCAPSLAYANQVAWQIAFRHGQALEHPGAQRAVCPPGCGHQRFVVRIDQALGAHRLVLFEEAQLSLTGRFSDGKLTVARVWPTARDRHPSAPTDTDMGDGTARELVARACVAITPGATLEVRGDTRLLDGQPRLRSVDLLLLPFGRPPANPPSGAPPVSPLAGTHGA